MARTILIVDDIRTNREILKNILGGEYRVVEAAHGQEAVAVMQRDYRELSAVLLDLGMPVMDGFEVLAYMQASEQLSQLPVIVMTGQTDKDSEERALKLGAKDYISKPYKSAIIKQRIRNTINLRETAATVNALRWDPLTGLLTREAFFEQAAELVAAAPAGTYVMASFDVDKFKVINDQYGTRRGDAVLRRIAEVLKTGFEAQGGVCCRIAADDFAVLYPARLLDSAALADIRRTAAHVEGIAAPLALSIGRYVVDDKTLSPSAMYDRATLAAEAIKSRYDVQVAVYNEAMRERLLFEQEIVTEMVSALEGRQFELWFQPQYNHGSGAMIGAEALVRWRHPEKGMIPPSAFIPIFERNGFVYELDKFVWTEACRLLRTWLDRGLKPLPVSVNLSRYDVFQEDVVAVITGLTARYRLPPELLRLEITESAFAESTKQIVAVVKQLIDQGFTLEIDDFGSGYSSLNTLKSVPAQIVKLDMRFIEDDDDAQRSGNIIESVVRMTKWLGMSVIAEGVETLEQANFLKSIGCSYVQGYLYARPMPAAEYEANCAGADKEFKLLALETVESLDNNAFWDPKSMDTLIFNSYVGAACIYEYHNGSIELLRATDKYAQVIGSAGMTVEEALKLDWTEHLDGETVKRIIRDLQASAESKKEVSSEYVFLDLPGCPHETYLRSNMRVIATAGQRYLVYCTTENLTAQRQAEKREQTVSDQLQRIISSVNGGICAAAYDEGGTLRIIYANDYFYSMYGYTRAQFEAELSNPLDPIHPDDRERVLETVRRMVADRGAAVYEYRCVRRDGAVIRVRCSNSVTAFEGVSDTVLLSVTTDTTELDLARQKERQVSEQLQAVMDNIDCGITAVALQGDQVRYLLANDRYYAILGYTRAQYLDEVEDRVFDTIYPGDLARMRESIARVASSGEPAAMEYRALRRDGSVVWLRSAVSMTRFAGEEAPVQLCTYTDVTAERQAAQELLDNLPGGAALYEFDGETVTPLHLNKRYWELVDRAPGDYSTIDVLSAVHPDDRAAMVGEIAASIRSERDVNCDLRLLYGKGEYRLFHVAGRNQRRADGRYAIYAAFTPITDEALAIREMLPVALRAMMNTQSGFSFVKDRNLRYVCCSRAVYESLGKRSEAEVIGRTDEELADPASAALYTEVDRRVLESGESVLDWEGTMPGEDGEARYTRTSKFPLKDSHGTVIGLYGVGRDVTETKALRSRLELLTNSIPGGIAIYEGRPEALDQIQLTYFSDGFCGLFGYSREEYTALAAVNPLGLVFPEDKSGMFRQIQALALNGMPMDCVYRARTKDGGYIWVNLKATKGEPHGDRQTVNALLLDVTARQEALERLRVSEEVNRLAISHSRNIVCRYDVAKQTLLMPPGVNPIFGTAELLEDVPYGQVKSGSISPETAAAYTAFYEGILRGEKEGGMVCQRRAGEGWRWIEARSTTVFSDEGKPVSAVISFYDVTESFEKEAAYRKWQQSLRNMPADAYSLFRCTVGKRTSFDAVEGALLYIHFPAGEFDFDARTAEYAARCVYAEDVPRFDAFLRADALLASYYQGRRNVSLEYREKLPSGALRWLRLTVDLVEHPHAAGVESYLLFEDIDQAKRAELATLERAETDPLTGVMNRLTFAAQVNERIRASKPGEIHALLMLDIDGFKRVNDAFGHGAGDQALIDIADALRAALRHGDLVGRLGGDEFVIFLTSIPGDEIAAAKARQICALTRRAYSLEVEISGSVGIAMTPRDGGNFDTLYRKVDAALYHVKGTGKNDYAFFAEDMAEERLLPAPAESPQSGDKKRERKRRILIVDDNRVDNALMSGIFHDEFVVEKAQNGSVALIRLRHYGTALSAVLLDLMMPGMDGFAVLKEIQASPELRSIPVIVVSGDGDRETCLRAIRAGAVDYVTKPVDPEILRIRVRSAISKAENERLRAKNSFLEFQNGEVTRYRTVLERSGIVVVEHEWMDGGFTYDPAISHHLAGVYDDRKLWHILLADMVAETATVKQMVELVQAVATDRRRTDESMLARLRTPDRSWHWFRMSVYKVVNSVGLAEKIYLTFHDLGEKKPLE